MGAARCKWCGDAGRPERNGPCLMCSNAVIAILDNGRDYSDHAISFVELVGTPHWAFEIAATGLGFDIIGLVSKIEWRKSGTLTTAAAVLAGDPVNYPDDDEVGAIAKRWMELPTWVAKLCIGSARFYWDADSDAWEALLEHHGIATED